MILQFYGLSQCDKDTDGNKTPLFAFQSFTSPYARKDRVHCDIRESKTKLFSVIGMDRYCAKASLRDLVPYLKRGEGALLGTQSGAAFTAFQSAETLRKQPNDSALDAAIAQYKQATDLDPRYAIAHARMALAYSRLYAIRRIPEALDLAYRNCQVALSLNPGLADGHLALAGVFQQTGNEQGALNEIDRALSLDPSNRYALVWQAQIYTSLNRWDDAEKTLRRALKEHPNFWLAYHELGFGLHGQVPTFGATWAHP